MGCQNSRLLVLMLSALVGNLLLHKITQDYNSDSEWPNEKEPQVT